MNIAIIFTPTMNVRKTHNFYTHNFLTIKQEEYSQSGTLMNTSYFPKWTTVEGKYIRLQMLFVDEFEKAIKRS